MDHATIKAVLKQLNMSKESAGITPFRNEEDGEVYQAWRIQSPEREYVLKEAKGFELEIYRTFFRSRADMCRSFLEKLRWMVQNIS